MNERFKVTNNDVGSSVLKSLVALYEDQHYTDSRIGLLSLLYWGRDTQLISYEEAVSLKTFLKQNNLFSIRDFVYFERENRKYDLS